MWEHLRGDKLTHCRGGCCRGCCGTHEDTQEDLHAEFALDDPTVPQPPGHEPLVLLDRALGHPGHQLHLLGVVEEIGQAHQLVQVATLAVIPPLGNFEELVTAEVLECLGEVGVGHGVDGGGHVEGILPDLSMLWKAARASGQIKGVLLHLLRRIRSLPSSTQALDHSHGAVLLDVVVLGGLGVLQLLALEGHVLLCDEVQIDIEPGEHRVDLLAELLAEDHGPVHGLRVNSDCAEAEGLDLDLEQHLLDVAYVEAGSVALLAVVLRLLAGLALSLV